MLKFHSIALHAFCHENWAARELIRELITVVISFSLKNFGKMEALRD